MRTASSNKARMVEEKTCPRCGRQPASNGCRPVPLGFWCVRDGLEQDPATFIGASVGTDPAASDPGVKQARADEAKAQTGPALYTSDLVPILPETNSGEHRRLRDRETEARADRETAANRLVNERTATWAAEAAARRWRT
jgi:hypothetical protein